MRTLNIDITNIYFSFTSVNRPHFTTCDSRMNELERWCPASTKIDKHLTTYKNFVEKLFTNFGDCTKYAM